MDLEALEKELILQVMHKYKGNQTQAARYLNMSRRALGYRLEKYGVQGEAAKSLRHRNGLTTVQNCAADAAERTNLHNQV
jgi:hypothetical protein